MTKDDATIMKNIERLGERYCEEILGCWNKEKLQNNWWEGLKFLFSHSFMRGRRDKLSNEYYYFTINRLEKYFEIFNPTSDRSYDNLEKQNGNLNAELILKFKVSKNLGRKNSVVHPDFRKEVEDKNPIINILVTEKEVEVKWDNETYKKIISLGNDADIMMVLSVLNFISNPDDRKNIYDYMKRKIKENRIAEVYKELDGIKYIGDKIASFVIRDVALLNPELVKKEDYQWAFPVDTWVKKIAPLIDPKSEASENISTYFIKKCEKNGIETLKFAAGLWYLGSNSLEILIEDYLGKYEIVEKND